MFGVLWDILVTAALQIFGRL